MTKRIISLILSITLVFSVLCPAVHADGSADFGSCSHDWQTPIVHGYSITIPNSDISFGVEFQQCSKCHWYKHDASLFIVSATYYSPLAPDLNGIVPTELITYWCNKYYEVFGKNASAKKYETGGGSAGTGGVGRHPSGYQDSTGTPSINLDGVYIFALSHDYTYARINAASKTSSSTEDSKYSFPVYRYCADSTLKSTFDQGTITESGDSVKYSVKFDEYKYSGYFGERFKGVAPCDGQYSLYIRPKYSISGSVFSSSYNDSVFRSSSGDLGLYGLDSYYVAGSTISIYSNVSLNYIGGYYPKSVTYQFTGVPYLKCKPTAPLYSKKTNITINNNTWNGNIYQDNSTNLTYIYPQYTTINENNETVTNISNNPIIYNNETKQYYTYDTVTNNYYYITYETPTPSPSPSPDPTPTPAPGGDTGDTNSLLDVLVQIRDNMIQGFADIKATLVQGWADLSANFTLAIENLNLNITNIFNKKFPDQSTPETAQPSPSPSPSPEPVDPILPETQNLIIPKMNSNTFTDEHGTWVASGSSKYSDVFDFFHAFDRSTSDFWETNASPSYLQIEIPDPESYYIDGYIMRISKFNNRYAKDWTLQGSDDGNTWDDLDKQTGQDLSDMEEHKYPLTLRKAYKYYRVNMSNYASSMCSLSHFNLLGYDAKDVVTPTPAPTNPPSPSPTPDPGETPTPTPAPTDKPSNGNTNNFWNFVFPGGSDDGTENGHKGILWALISLLIAVVTFVLGLGSAYAYVFPFLPAGLVTTIHICVLVLLLFAIIKFVRSFL